MLLRESMDSPLLRMFQTEYAKEYRMMVKNGHIPTDNDIRVILGYPTATSSKKLFGLF